MTHFCGIMDTSKFSQGKKPEGVNQMKVVYHADELEKWPMILANVTNMIVDCKKRGETYVIEVIANSAAVPALSKTSPLSETAESLRTLSGQGVIFKACRNTLTGLNIRESELFEFVTVVPAAVVELVHRQEEGFAYLKP